MFSISLFFLHKDIKKLTDLYEEGYACAKKMFEEKRILQK